MGLESFVLFLSRRNFGSQLEYSVLVLRPNGHIYNYWGPNKGDQLALPISFFQFAKRVQIDCVDILAKLEATWVIR